MKTDKSPIFVFDMHAQAEAAIQSLNKAGFDLKQLSLVGKGYHTEEQPIGFYSAGDRIKAWGGAGAFWGGIWGLLVAPAVFFIPGLGLIALAGPVVAALVGALEGAVVGGGISALGAALSQLGVPVDQVLRYQTAIKVDKYVLMVHGSPEDATVARNILSGYTTLDAA
jgi:hypothetical protein